jgi:hypothetical protein
MSADPDRALLATSLAFAGAAVLGSAVAIREDLPGQLSLLFLELSGYYVNIVQLHVNAADVLVRRGIDRDGSR